MDCNQEYPIDQVIYNCERCGGALDVQHDLDHLKTKRLRGIFDSRLGSLDSPFQSGVWRYKELVYPDVPDEYIVSRPEGNTNLYPSTRLAKWAGVEKLYLKHEGENPTGSFKDRGMTSGVTQANLLGMERVACASTGNTSASLAAYASLAGLKGIVFFQNKQIALGKLAQAVAYGATVIQVNADFDRNLKLVRELAITLGIYVLNSVNPFRLEGQKTIVLETIQQLRWHAPDWIICPGGNLGNSAAFGKALNELHRLGLVDRLPRLAIVQAEGANPLFLSYQRGFDCLEAVHAETIATAIKIGNPVNYAKAVRALRWTDGVVEEVSDQEIMDAKALIDRQGIGCEPASACSLAGLRRLVDRGIVKSKETVVCVLTGHILKDADAVINYHRNALENVQASYPNQLFQAEATIESLSGILEARQRTLA
jgi:threonine synthase